MLHVFKQCHFATCNSVFIFGKKYTHFKHIILEQIPRNNNPLVTDNNFNKFHPNPSYKWKVMTWTHDKPLGHGQQLCEVSSRSKLPVNGYGPETNVCYVLTGTCYVWPLTLTIRPRVKVMIHPLIMDSIFCEILSRSNMTLWRYDPEAQILGMCTLWHWHSGYDLGARSWHILWSWVTIVWNIIQIQQNSKRYELYTDLGHVCILTWEIGLWARVMTHPWIPIVLNFIQIEHGRKDLWIGHEVSRRMERQIDMVIPITPKTLFAGV